jgi:hypothetical protein
MVLLLNKTCAGAVRAKQHDCLERLRFNDASLGRNLRIVAVLSFLASMDDHHISAVQPSPLE